VQEASRAVQNRRWVNETERSRLVVRSVVGVAVTMVVVGALLFGAAGTVHWVRGWIFFALFFILSTIATLDLFRADPALLNERLKPPLQKAQPLADKLVLSTVIAGFVATLVLAPLDVFHLHLLPQPGKALAVLGLVAFVAGWWIAYRAVRANAFAAPVVKLQEERGQHVIEGGPYAIVRHPMYAGGILYFIGMPLWLGSTAATLVAVASSAAIVARIFVEESLLRRSLPGYAAYAQRVRYRLIPYIW
jgi:protein-S-isoprenylcysteine O-methyltransferase Ste14